MMVDEQGQKADGVRRAMRAVGVGGVGEMRPEAEARTDLLPAKQAEEEKSAGRK